VQTLKDGSDVTGFGSFDNSTCKRVILDLLEPGDLRFGQVVIKRVAVVKVEAVLESRYGWIQRRIWRQMRSGQKK